MILKENSIQARLYRWFYDVKEMPQSLCQYFWRLVVIWVLLIPFGFFVIPTLWVKEEKFHFGLRVFIGAVAYFCLFLLYTMGVFTAWFLGYKITGIELGSMVNVGGFLWVCVILFCLNSIFKHINTYIQWNKEEMFIEYKDGKDWSQPTGRQYIICRNGKYVLEEKQVLFYEKVRTKINKYCTKITWK